MYIQKLMNVPFNGATKTYEQENFKMTVVKMDMMMMNTTDDGHVKISAPKVTLNYNCATAKYTVHQL